MWSLKLLFQIVFPLTLVISQREVVQHSYEYTIPDINLLPQKIDQHFDSPAFFANSHPDIQWCLRMYPKGCWDTSKFAVELRNVTLKEKLPVVVKCQFSFFNNGVEIQSEWAHFTNLYTSPDSFPLHIQVSLDKLKRTNDQNELKIVCLLVCEVQRSWFTKFPR